VGDSDAVQRLKNQVQPYAWGSATAIPALLGTKADGTPQAELWLGAHPVAPSKVESGATLIDWLAADPATRLGDRSTKAFGPQLPFLLKVLAAAEPLSLQAHPSLAQAKEGFAREDAAGLARTASNRNYRDPNHKPEIICALSRFEALCGFRSVAQTIEIFRALGLDVGTLQTRGLKAYFDEVMSAPKATQQALVARAVEGARKAPAGLEKECGLVARLSAKYPGDVGVVGALLLNHLWLEPGQALFLGAGNLHAYLEGTGVELMANSDNVLRGGLTPKHVDVPELLRVLQFVDGPAKVLTPSEGLEGVYETPVPDFRLSRLVLKQQQVQLPRGLPQILLCTEGTARVGPTSLERGQSVFVAANEPVMVSGEAVVFRATPGL